MYTGKNIQSVTGVSSEVFDEAMANVNRLLFEKDTPGAMPGDILEVILDLTPEPMLQIALACCYGRANERTDYEVMENYRKKHGELPDDYTGKSIQKVTGLTDERFDELQERFFKVLNDWDEDTFGAGQMLEVMLGLTEDQNERLAIAWANNANYEEIEAMMMLQSLRNRLAAGDHEVDVIAI